MTTIQVSGADRTLYHVAARQYGDATLWTQIAAANGMTDPMLPPGLATLRIPPLDPALTLGRVGV